MTASTTYYWRAVAQNGFGTTYGTQSTITTGELPAGIDPEFMSFRTRGTATEVEDVLFNYGCDEQSDNTDFIVVADVDGNVVWYQDPREAIDRLDAEDQVTITGLNMSEYDNNILAILDHDYIAEWSLDGNLVGLYCRDTDPSSGTQVCVDADVVPDGYVDRYVHHDVERTGDRLYALSADQSWDTSTTCDGADEIIVDGCSPSTGRRAAR
jgi:hypothetical protein